jgi:hypothetical protein
MKAYSEILQSFRCCSSIVLFAFGKTSCQFQKVADVAVDLVPVEHQTTNAPLLIGKALDRIAQKVNSGQALTKNEMSMLSSVSSGDNSEALSWSDKLKKAQTELTRIKIQRERGELVDIEEARRQVAQGIQEAKVALMGVPGRVADLMPPGVAPQVRKAVQTEIRAVLAGLTAGRFANLDQKKDTEDND